MAKRLTRRTLLIWQLAVGGAWAQGFGGVRGVVFDAEFDGPVPEAQVRMVELNRQTNTTESGHFLFTEVPPGSYTLTVSKPGYERHVQSGVVVAEGQLAEVSIGLKGEFTEMEEVVVRDMDLADTSSEVGLLQLRGATLTFQDSISRDLMSRAGAGDAASALRLVVGATVAEGKYASVRGLSDRYVGAALNDIRIPSSDPRKRAVHLDVFPAGTIESITVSKTFTPDLPGDYSGGGVNIRTVGIPEKSFFKISASREINSRFHGKDGYRTYNGGGISRWGRHVGERAMPEGADEMEYWLEMYSWEPRADNYDFYVREIDRVTWSMAPAMGTKSVRYPDGNYGYTVSVGDRGNWGEATVGWNAAFTYGKKYKIESGPQQDLYIPRWPVGSDYPDEIFNWNVWTNESGLEEVKWSLLTSVGLSSGEDTEVTLTFLRNRATSDRASLRVSEPEIFFPPYWEQRQAIHYTERSLNVMQLQGRHRWAGWPEDFAGVELDWFGAHNVAEQEEPDVRYFRNFVVDMRPFGGRYRYSFVPPKPGTQTTIDKAVRIWRNTREDNTIVGLNLAFPFRRPRPDSPASLINIGPQEEPWAEADGRIKTGFTRDWTKRTYRQNTFWYESLAPYSNDSPHALWTDVFTDREALGSQSPTRRVIKPRSGAGPGEAWEGDTLYEGWQNFPSGYWLVEYPLTTRWKVLLGARLEGTELRIDPEADRMKNPARAFAVAVNQQGLWQIEPVSEEAASVDIRQADWLRSVSTVYDLTGTMKLRGTWSQTIARPTLLELAPVITTDYVTGDNLVGNKELKLSRVINEDVRWEWFPVPGEVLAVSFFNKRIQDPIDREAFVFLSDEYLISVNLPEGGVRGWEFEVRKQLDFLPDFFQFFSLGANYTLIDAWVKVPLEEYENYAADDNMLANVGLQPGATNRVHRMGQTKRDMEGQPNYLWNVNLTWDYEPWGTSLGFFYTVRGDMLRSGVSMTEEGKLAIPNTYSKGTAAVNFSLSQTFAKNWKFTFQAKNLLDPWIKEVYRFPDGTEVMKKQYQEGVAYSFALGASW